MRNAIVFALLLTGGILAVTPMWHQKGRDSQSRDVPLSTNSAGKRCPADAVADKARMAVNKSVQNNVSESSVATKVTSPAEKPPLIVGAKSQDHNVLDRALASPEAKVRECAAGLLAKDGGNEEVEMLLRAITSERDAIVKENMIETLRSVRNPEAIPVLAKQAMDQSDLTLHRVCRNNLSAMDAPQVVASLVSILVSSPGKSGEPIAYALAHMVSEEAVPGLIEGSRSTEERVFGACLRGLGNVGNAEAYSTLFDVIAAEPQSCKGQIANVALKQAAMETRSETLVKVCEEVIGLESNIDSVKTAVDSLVVIPGDKALSALKREAEKGHSGQAAEYVVDGIRRHQALWSGNAPGEHSKI